MKNKKLFMTLKKRPYKAGLEKQKPVKRGSTVVELKRPQRREAEGVFCLFFYLNIILIIL